MGKTKKILGIIGIVALLIGGIEFVVQPAAASDGFEGEAPVADVGKFSSPYLVRTFVDDEGREIDEIIVPGRPPDIKAPVAMVPQRNPAMEINVLSNVPAFDWCYGCSATSAAMMAGYYDNTGYTNMYAGPTNGGVCPMDNSVWGETSWLSGPVSECPLSATHQGVDGRAIEGHVDDYWIDSLSEDPDPFIGHWEEHVQGDCTGDYMGTNQYLLDNIDGSTIFFFDSFGGPVYDYTFCEPEKRDGCHGLRLFAESRGYTVVTNFSQYIYGQAPGNPNNGFTFSAFQSEIDAGRPVLIQVEDHTMLGYGYNTAGEIVYIHDTWDHGDHQMTWGGTYGAGNRQHYGVSVIQLEPAPEPDITVSPTGFEESGPADTIWTKTLTIGNVGGASLSYNISDEDCLWLDESPKSGSVEPGGSHNVTVTINTTGLAVSDYGAEIIVSSNDPEEPEVTVPVTLHVSPGAGVTWFCPLDHMALIAPYPVNGRPYLDVSANLSEVSYDVDWFQVLWLNESTGDWYTFYSGFTVGNTLLTLETDQFYYVVVSEPGELTIPQG